MSDAPHDPSVVPLDRLLVRLRYWQAKKLILDAARPDFTREQLRELNAAESQLLALDVSELDAEVKRLHAAEAEVERLRTGVHEFVQWWHEHREGSPNAAYLRVDRFVADVEKALPVDAPSVLQQEKE